MRTQNQPYIGSQNPNGNQSYPSDNSVIFHQVNAPSVSGHSSVIHVMDRSGNQSALQVGNGIVGGVNLSLENLSHLGGNAQKQTAQNVIQSRKPGHPNALTVQLDGLDDVGFEDLSDDDTTLRSVGHASKKSKKSRTASERLEESDLDSEDDDDDEEPGNSDAVDNVVVCQYEKVSRTRNRWKFHLKSGMCSLNSKEYVFHKATGDAEF